MCSIYLFIKFFVAVNVVRVLAFVFLLFLMLLSWLTENLHVATRFLLLSFFLFFSFLFWCCLKMKINQN
jgi:hypothetical protein